MKLFDTLTSETWRALIALAVAVVVSYPFARSIAGDGRIVPEPEQWALPLIAVHQATYATLTAVILAAPAKRLKTWAERSQRPTAIQRYVMLTEPGAGLGVYLAVLSIGILGLAVSGNFGPIGGGKAAMIGLLIVSAWATMVVSFALDYLRIDGRQGWAALGFPTTDGAPHRDRTVGDYLYVSAAISATAGTTDVDILTPEMRQSVAIHGVLAFLFNTVILATAITVLL
ncbi:DUF1345 domain-containing protein [Marihabitans asiaticum]|uniref:Putative membrane protein n=1 Tax=Marihabitans asiaticum TaxID=415218 RepID=A0A560WG19_9MICO|nr:DUF1345 domain-containing protein [Marihabitans asiaticum]TWD16641.1 putative membrane protein [Marihabitans asiaticum]